MNVSDDDLMRAIAAGNRSAFGMLMERHRRWVRGLMQVYVHDENEAEDLTQEAFCRVYQNRAHYRGEGSFPAWLKRIAVNAAKDYLRKRRHAVWLSLDEHPELLDDPNAPDPLSQLSSQLLRDDLRSAIQSLPSEQRLTLAMHYFGDMDVKDIAWATNCSIGTVRSRLFNGLKRVRRTLIAHWENQVGEEVP